MCRHFRSFLSICISVPALLVLSVCCSAANTRHNALPRRIVVHGEVMKIVGTCQGDLDGDGRIEKVLALQEMHSPVCSLGAVQDNIHVLRSGRQEEKSDGNNIRQELQAQCSDQR